VREIIISKATTEENAESMLKRLAELKECTIDNKRIRPDRREQYYKKFLGDHKNTNLLADNSKDEFTVELLAYMDEAEKKEAMLEARKSGKKNGNGAHAEIKIAAGDVITFSKIQGVAIPKAPESAMEAFFESRDLDPHEFLYLTIKVLRLISRKELFAGVEVVFFNSAIREFGDQEGKAEKLLKKLITPVHDARDSRLKLKDTKVLEKEADEDPTKRPLVELVGLVYAAMDAIHKPN
jgi:uncharacterized protein YxeA